MTESETEAETIDRLEAALRRIAAAAHAPKRQVAAPAAAAPAGAAPAGAELDRAALIESLDLLIARLRAGLNPNRPE